MLPEDLKPHIWNRKMVQMGTADMAKDKLKEVRCNLGAADREDLISFADVIDFDERKKLNKLCFSNRKKGNIISFTF